MTAQTTASKEEEKPLKSYKLPVTNDTSSKNAQSYNKEQGIDTCKLFFAYLPSVIARESVSTLLSLFHHDEILAGTDKTEIQKLDSLLYPHTSHK